MLTNCANGSSMTARSLQAMPLQLWRPPKLHRPRRPKRKEWNDNNESFLTTKSLSTVAGQLHRHLLPLVMHNSPPGRPACPRTWTRPEILHEHAVPYLA